MLRNIERREREAAEREAAEERARKKAEAERRKAEKLRALEKKREEKERKRAERSRKQTVERVLRESGVLHNLEEIRRGRLRGAVRKHALLVDIDNATATLVWGNKFTVENGRIDYEKFYGFGRGEKDYSYIKVEIDPDTQTVRIDGRSTTGEISNKRWRTSAGKAEIINALAQAYLEPNRASDREAKPISRREAR